MTVLVDADRSEHDATTKSPSTADWFFRVLGILTIVLLGLLIYDLFALAREPYNPSISVFPMRIVLGLFAGTIGILISNLIIWRVPGNPVGWLLLLWSIGGLGWQFSYNFGSSTLDQYAFFIFAYIFGALAATSVVLLFFYFPSGKVYPPGLAPFVPVFIALRGIGTALTVASLDPAQYNFTVNPFQITGLQVYSRVFSAIVGVNGDLFAIIGLVLGSYFLFQRYRQAEIIEQQQIKWFAWAGMIMTVMVIIFAGVHVIIFQGFSPIVPIIDYPFFIVASTVPTFAIGAAVLRYRLWDVNFLISRTVLYAVLTAILAAVFAASAAVINQIASRLFETDTGAPAALVSTILIVAIFQPVRNWIEEWINERYFPENRDLARDFVEFSGEFRSVITEDEMQKLITRRICRLLNSRWGCIFLRKNGDRFSPSEVWNIDLDQIPDKNISKKMMTSWGTAKAIRESDDKTFPVLVPLYISRIQEDNIIGILGLGPRQREQGYSRNDLRGLTKFGKDAGRVIYSYDLRSKKQGN